MEAALRAQLPADEASLAEVNPDGWRHRTTPGAFYDEVKADFVIQPGDKGKPEDYPANPPFRPSTTSGGPDGQ